MSKRRDFILAFCMALAFLLVFSWSTSPLYLTYGGDSPFFQIIGLGITQGKVPYVDLFDHKGPVPFFIDALGYSLGLGRLGIFLVQLVWMTVTVFLLHRLAMLFSGDSRKSWFAVLLTLLPLIDFFTEGNQVEEWELPFVAGSLLITSSYVLGGSGSFRKLHSFLLGLFFGIVFLVRPNDGVMWIGSLYFGLFVMWIVRKQFAGLFANVASFIGGAVLAAAPFLAYFAAHDALDDMFFGMILHNLQYVGDVAFSWGGIGMIIIPLIYMVALLMLFFRDGKRDFAFLLIPMLVFTVILIGKRDYYHYLIPFVPYTAICYVMCLNQNWKRFVWTVSVLFALFSYREFSFIFRAVSLHDEIETFYAQTDALYDNVPEAERNTIWNYNLVTYGGGRKPHLLSMMASFLHKGITPSSPVLAAYDLYHLEDRFGIRSYEPLWVVLDPADYYNKDFGWIEENYELVATSPAEPVCELRLYRKKADDKH